MKAILMSVMIFFGLQVAHAEPVEKEFFNCTSQVQGFESFRIMEITDVVENQLPKVTYQLKTGILFFEEVWNQYGEATLAAESPVFQSEFTRKYTPPILPLPIPEQPAPQDPTEEYFMYVSINLTGSGSVSVNGDLAPIKCQRLF